MTEDTLEHSARRIAEHGREALLSRLRPAFEEAARTHADVLQIEPDQLEDMIQRAADRADGLQWRRALASVATQELGIGLGEALSHPAVERAQEIVGAPSYEESLAQLGVAPAGATPVAPAQTAADEAGAAEAAEAEAPAPEPEVADEVAPPVPEPEVAEEAAPEPAAEAAPPEAAPDESPAAEESLPEETVAEEAMGEEELASEYEAVAEETNGYEIDADETAAYEADAEAYDTAADEALTEPDVPESLRLSAVHLGGIATLEPGEEGLELRIGPPGLDIARKQGRVLGRLRWREIKSLEVSPGRGLRRRRRQGRTQLVVRTEHGDASFEIPDVPEDELREQLNPLVEQYTSRS